MVSIDFKKTEGHDNKKNEKGLIRTNFVFCAQLITSSHTEVVSLPVNKY